MFGIETYKHIAFLDALSGDKCHFDNLASNRWIQRRRLKSFSVPIARSRVGPVQTLPFQSKRVSGSTCAAFAASHYVVVEQPPAAGKKPGQGDNN